MKSLAEIAVLIACLSFIPPAAAQSRTSIETQINTYVAEIDRYVQRNPRAKRMFGDTAGYDDSKPVWREFKRKVTFDEAVLYESAFVWTRAGKPVYAGFTLSSPSGDWAHFINYYFRDDGSVAKIDGQFNTFYGDVSVIRKLYFNGAGVQISSTQKFLDLKTRKPTKKPGEMFDQPVPVYRNVTELPFYKLL